MSALFVLALEKPFIIRTEVFLFSIEETKKERIFHFRFFDKINNNHREMIQQYIIQKQFELLENKNKENWHEKKLASLVRGQGIHEGLRIKGLKVLGLFSHSNKMNRQFKLSG